MSQAAFPTIKSVLLLRTLFGLLVAPFVGAVAAPVAFMIATAPFGGIQLAFPLVASLGSAIATAAPNALLVSVLAGLPAHVLLLNLGWRHAAVYTIGGALLGFVTFLTLPPSAIPQTNPDWLSPVYAYFSSLAGGIGGLVFSLIRRPDRDLTLPPSPQTGAP